jgi:glycosyltransferase involved in cell wall biosynthesis
MPLSDQNFLVALKGLAQPTPLSHHGGRCLPVQLATVWCYELTNLMRSTDDLVSSFGQRPRGEASMSGSRSGRVSVVIPTLDRPPLLRQAVDSVLRQSCPVDQIVVVDDGSKSTEGLAELGRLSPAIEVIRGTRTLGPAAARNIGLEHATGEFVCFLDDDDLLEQTFVERGLSVLAARSDVDGVFFRYHTTTLNAAEGLPLSPIAQTTSLIRGQNVVPRATIEERPVTAFLRYLVPIHSGFLRRSAVGSTRFPESLRQGEDTYFWISLVAAGRRFVLDEHTCVVIRRHQNNTTRSTSAYLREIQPCYLQLIRDGLLTDPDDAYLAHLKLACFGSLTGSTHALSHLRHVAASPQRLVFEMAFWSMNLLSRLRRAMAEAR